MGCNCKKQPEVILPQPTPEPIMELPKHLTEEEIDWFNNLDEINPIRRQTRN